MSAGLNTVAGTLYEDFVMYVRNGVTLPEAQQMFITKMIVLVVGLICAAFVTVIDKLGAIYQVSTPIIPVKELQNLVYAYI